MKVNKLLPPVILAFALCILLLPMQSADAQASERPNSLEEGSWALLFQIDGLPRIGFFDGMLAMKYHLSARRAIRLGLGGNAATEGGGSRLQSGISAQGQYFIYPWPEREINLYIGAGPRLAYVLRRADEAGTFETRYSAWEIGLTGRLGVEWFAMKSLSFLAEYGNLLAMRIESRDSPDLDRSFRDYVYRSTAKLGIAAYF